MKYQRLGQTDIIVSQICFGTLTISPLQKNLTLSEGLRVMKRAIDCGINFIDTADLYETYPFIKALLKDKKDLVIATKSYAYDISTAEASLERALRGIERDYVDIFLLHEQESELTLKGHYEAIEYFLKQKEKGHIRSFGISTHFVEATKVAADMKEIDIIHPILNYKGIGIVDGTRADMEDAISKAYQNGKGIYLMKALGGGHLIKEMAKAYNYILDYPYKHSVAIGMQRTEEVDANISYFENRKVPEDTAKGLEKYKRDLIIQSWCQACGNCIKRCNQGALEIVEGKAVVNKEKCVLCGYCGSVCRELAIKII